jgi:glycosyltransferase involved in cell wall biosynthesis
MHNSGEPAVQDFSQPGQQPLGQNREGSPMASASTSEIAQSRPDKTPSKARNATLAVIIPAFNEEGAVRATVIDVRRVLTEAGVTHEIVVVNDGSVDNTRAEAQASGARVIHFAENVGYGHALKAGIAATTSDLVAILDADGTYPAETLPEMIAMSDYSDMVVGDRGAAMANVPIIRRPAKWVLNNLASLLAQRKINDLNSGLRVFRRPALERFVHLLPDGFSFTTTITLCMLASNLRVTYLPITYGQRVGHSKIRARHFFNFILLVVRLTAYFQPLRIFLPVGAFLFGVGFLKAIYDVFMMDLSETAVFGILGGIMVWSLGLLADMISRIHLQPTIRAGGEDSHAPS